ncbi:MAG: hypothetical protein HYY16_10790, partial [Planctomycetes bacterium]|nr:hypothetical protein [Planctomycetota bacterium]
MDALLFLSFPSRLTGVFAAPGAVGRSLASQPRWLGALLVCLILSVTSAAAVYLHPTGKKLILEEVRKNASPAGTKEGASFFEEHYKTAAAFGIGGDVVGTTLVLLLSATLLWLTFTIIMGA